jgi:type IV pilus assembly protein PilV
MCTVINVRKIMRQPLSPKSAQQGVVLIEAMLAILLFSIGVLAIVGLQAAMIKNTADSKFRAEASYIAQKRVGQMWADPTNAISYVETNFDISGLLPEGKRSVVNTSGNQYQVTVTWKQPGSAAMTHNFTTTIVITETNSPPPL